MQIQPVSALSIAGITFSLLVAFALPITLCVFACRKLKAKVSCFFIGCLTFIVFALILEQIFHVVVFSAAGAALTGNIWLYGLYGGLAAAAFEETGRFLAMKLFMKKKLSRENALMYGIGHGGIEAILLVGVLYINNMITAIMINTGSFETSLSLLDPSLQETTVQSLSPLWTTPGYHFFIAGIERILALLLQICLSVIIYQAVSGKKRFFLLAFGIHFLVDFAAVVASNYISILWVELITLVLVAATAFFTLRIYKKG